MNNIMQLSEQEIVEQYNSMRKVRRDNKKSIVRKDGMFLTSVVYTNPAFAKRIVDYFTPQFKPNDTFLDPCAGKNAFFDNLPQPKSRCEIQDGIDFLQFNNKVDWCFANFPWRGLTYSALARHSFEISENVVSLVKFSTAIGTNKRFTDASKNNMHMKEIIFCKWQDAAFTFPDGSVKGPEGFILSIIHWQKNWQAGTTWNTWIK